MSFCTLHPSSPFFFFFNDTATTEIYTLSLHDALPISRRARSRRAGGSGWRGRGASRSGRRRPPSLARSEEHTSELQSRLHLVCRLLLEKKKKRSLTSCKNRVSDTDAAQHASSSRTTSP